LIDRTADLRGLIELNDTYQGWLEEYGKWDVKLSLPRCDVLGRLLDMTAAQAGKTYVFTAFDDLWSQIALRTLPDALRWLDGTSVLSEKAQAARDQHRLIIGKLQQFIQSSYVFDVLLRVQRNQLPGDASGRLLGFCDWAPAIAFRMLSVLRTRNKAAEATSIALMLAEKFGLEMLANWDMIDNIMAKAARTLPQPPAQNIGWDVPPIVHLLSTVLKDTWRRDRVPVNEHYCSHYSPLPRATFRWFVGVVGGVTATELRMLKEVARRCRSQDEFVFMTTDVKSPMEFMNEVLTAQLDETFD
jgi:hypothetical protein